MGPVCVATTHEFGAFVVAVTMQAVVVQYSKPSHMESETGTQVLYVHRVHGVARTGNKI